MRPGGKASMAEFKFSCPQCNQHIECDVSYSGMQINCPSCQKCIVVPSAPQVSATPRASCEAPPPPPPPVSAPSLATRQSTTVPASGRRFAGAPDPSGAPPQKAKSKALRNVLVITACVVVLAGLGVGGWFGFTKMKSHQAAQEAKKGNPAAQVTAPTAAAAVQALSILTKVHSAYTNLSSVTEDGTITLFLNLSNLTVADLNPAATANTRATTSAARSRNARNAARRPPGMPGIITNTTVYSVKRAPTNWFYLAGEAASKLDRQTLNNTFAVWSADKGMFVFTDSHRPGVQPTYMQMPVTTITAASGATEQARNMQQLFSDPAQLTKIIKDLGQTDDESVNGHGCYTLTARVLGQKIKVWVDKTSYLIWQSEITLGGPISDADVDDAFSLFAAGITNVPPQQMDMIKAQLKLITPAATKIRGAITSTTRNIEVNPKLASDDFNYAVPEGVRLTTMPGAATPIRPPIRAAPIPLAPPKAN
jgi:outer membrane lipoprotein-sorting protein